MLRLELHAPDPVCRQAPDWRVGLDGDRWIAVDVSGRWPLIPPWWKSSKRPPELRGIIHLLICWTLPGDLPSGPAEVAGELVAQLMAGYAAGHPHLHRSRGRAWTPDGYRLAAGSLLPLDCPPWEWGVVAEEARWRAAEGLGRPAGPLQRLWGLT